MKSMLDRLLKYRLVRFALTGGMATAIHIVVAFSFIHLIKDSVLYANMLGFSIAFLFSYFAQTVLVFRQKVNLSNALRFFMVQFGALMISQAISELFSDWNSYVRIMMVVVILPIITYLIHKVWTYSGSSESTPH
ncbi:GtrA family protein [Vibrio variabilis]|uniref:GtrA family protein n=1 Tax=Vibrio variabilis TaxID=990271 RepID=UPI000DD8A1F7|nr:GtrA family protein [Vibrio variabilis]